tara:strand:+ start:362 stop:607 length:246 start_codon:yes stop_codon:yes gene_type:complete
MKKVTFATLKKYARNNVLFHKVRGEFSGMVDGMEFYNNLPYNKTTLKDLEKFKVSKNWLTIKENQSIELSNCCYYVNFIVK